MSSKRNWLICSRNQASESCNGGLGVLPPHLSRRTSQLTRIPHRRRSGIHLNCRLAVRQNASPNSPIQNKQQLNARPVIKYTALFFFDGAFLPSLCINSPPHTHWLLRPLRESNLQLFALVAIWVANKIHDSRPLSVKSFKSLGDMLIIDQHFTTRDFAEGEMIFLEVLRFEIGASKIAFVYLEDLHIQLRELSKLGELVSFDVCMDIMDLLYETEETSVLFDSPCSLAASIIVTAYVVSVRKQQWEFPILPWVKFVTSYEEEEIMGIVRKILQHILKPFMQI